MTKRNGIVYEVINHGVDHAQYFPGCGVAFTPYSHVATGAGMNAREAYRDAIDQLYSYPGVPDGFTFPKQPQEVRSGSVPMKDRNEDSELYCYVSVRIKL